MPIERTRASVPGGFGRLGPGRRWAGRPRFGSGPSSSNAVWAERVAQRRGRERRRREPFRHPPAPIPRRTRPIDRCSPFPRRAPGPRSRPTRRCGSPWAPAGSRKVRRTAMDRVRARPSPGGSPRSASIPPTGAICSWVRRAAGSGRPGTGDERGRRAQMISSRSGSVPSSSIRPTRRRRTRAPAKGTRTRSPAKACSCRPTVAPPGP